MTERGLKLKELRDEMKFSATPYRGQTTASTVLKWVKQLDQIMQIPEWDPNQAEMFPALSILEAEAKRVGEAEAVLEAEAKRIEAAEAAVMNYDLNEMRHNILYLLASFGDMTDPEICEHYRDNFGATDNRRYSEIKSAIRQCRTECVTMGWVGNFNAASRHHDNLNKTKYSVWSITGTGFSALQYWKVDTT